MPKLVKKPKPLHIAFANKIKALWQVKEIAYGRRGEGGRINHTRLTSFILHPINTFKHIKHCLKNGAANDDQPRPKHVTRRALNVMAQARILNGPELNIVLLGLPFIISFGILHSQNKARYRRQQRRNQEAIRLQFQQRNAPINANNAETDDAAQIPIPHGPLSDEVLPFYLAMVRAGMSQEGAYQFCTGECENTEITAVLSEEDCHVLIEQFGELLYPLEDDEAAA